jgi:hypothetical protein
LTERGRFSAPAGSPGLPLRRADDLVHRAGFRQVDFKRDAEAARRTINRWVEKQTNDKIKELFREGMLCDATRLVLANAVYFKADWASQFKKDQTRDGDFHLSVGKKVKAPLMRQTAKYRYHATKTLQALELPYVGKRLGMVVLLPRKVVGRGGQRADARVQGRPAVRVLDPRQALGQHPLPGPGDGPQVSAPARPAAAGRPPCFADPPRRAPPRARRRNAAAPGSRGAGRAGV